MASRSLGRPAARLTLISCSIERHKHWTPATRILIVSDDNEVDLVLDEQRKECCKVRHCLRRAFRPAFWSSLAKR